MNKTKVFAILASLALSWGHDNVSDAQTPVHNAHGSYNAHNSPPKNTAGKTRGKVITLVVTASAYTSSAAETDNTPYLTAWGDTLKPGMKAIAVSRDLIKMGLQHGARVTIDGFKGVYVVRDKMHRRWKKKIDIYMGTNRNKAINWGKRKVIIRWVR